MSRVCVRRIGARIRRPPRPLRGTARLRAAWLTGALIGLDCAAAGFDVVAAPVLDLASRVRTQ